MIYTPKVGVRDEAIVDIIRANGSKSRCVYHNLILDCGLDAFINNNFLQIVSDIGAIKSDVPIDAGNVETDFVPVHGQTDCSLPALGISDWWQNSTVQGIQPDTSEADSQAYDAVNYKTTYTRTWDLLGSDFGDMQLVYTTGKNLDDSRFTVGGSLEDLTDIIIAKDISKWTSTPGSGDCLDFPCRAPTDPVSHEMWDLQVLTKLWNRIQFKNDLGDPTPLTIDSGTIIRLTYTVTLDIPTTPNVQTLTINGVSTTVTTRCYVAGLTNWGLTQFFSNFRNMPLADSFESNSMPAINANQVGSNSVSGAKVELAVGRPFDVEFRWGATTGNFASGIGTVIHGPNRAFITIFNPKPQKDNTQRFIFQARYNWGRVGGD